MTTQIVKDGEISLNAYKYTLVDKLKGRYVSRTVPKQNTGSDSFDKEQFLSNYSLNDLRGGIGADEYIDDNRYWFGDCITAYKNHIRLPRLATSITMPTVATYTLTDGGLETWTDVNNLTNWTKYAGTTLTREGTTKYAGTYSAKIVTPGTDATTYYIKQVISWNNDFRGKRLTWAGYANCNKGARCRLTIEDSAGHTHSSAHSGGATWEALTATRVLDAGATSLTLYWEVDDANGDAATAYFDAGTLTGYTTNNSYIKFANFDSDLYISWGDILYKLNTGTGNTLTYVNNFISNITALVPSLNSRLYVFIGDSANYWYVSTADVATQSNSAATYAVQWDAKLIKVTAAGVATYSTDPDGAGPTWTTCGNITDIASEIETFFVGPDSTGAEVVYCATNSILKMLDLANAKWEDSSLKLPSHPNGGKGACYWRDAIFLSYGLGVKRYVPENALVQEIGLTKDGGLPSEYNGEIVKFLGDSASNEMFALVDASQVTGAAKSGLYAYTGNGWEAWWLDTSNDGEMTDCIISPVYAYRLWWSVGGAVKYISVPRGVVNPSQLSIDYAASGFLVSSWFDASTAAYNKLAKRLTSFTKGVTTTETVALKYRTDKAYNTLADGWTTMDTLNTAGENGINVEPFASGAGVAFGNIQFRLDLARGGTTTLTPDIHALTLAYRIVTGGNWVWEAKIKLDGAHGESQKEQITNLETAAESATDVIFIYREDSTNEVHYVKVFLPENWNQTGKFWGGEYVLQMIEM